ETGDLVCADLDGLADDSSDCAEPPLDSRFGGLLTKRLPDGRTAVGGMFAAKVTGGRVTLPDHSQVVIPGTASATYSARIHDALRLAFAVLGQLPTGGDLLDANARRIGNADPDDCTCPKPRPLHTVFRGPHGVRLVGHGRFDNACIALAPQTDCEEYAGGEAV